MGGKHLGKGDTQHVSTTPLVGRFSLGRLQRLADDDGAEQLMRFVTVCGLR
jgi:hypothetical protein